jgi:hypothetical protein
MKRIRAGLPAAITLAFIVFVTSVAAHHGTGDDASNMSHVANSPQGGPTNSDLAFWKKLVFAGNYGGFRIIDASKPSAPRVLADVSCPGAQGDVGIYGNDQRRLLFVSVDSPQATSSCSGPAEPNRFEGIRIFDVSDPRNPTFVKAVHTDCGSHTHTVVPDDANNRALIYVASYILGAPSYRCPDSDGAPTHSKISVVEVPLANPENASVIAEPSLPSPNGCHDIGVFLELKRAAAACLTEGQIWDISDPVQPRVVNRIVNPAINIWHSGAFTWDGKYAVFGDEEGGAIMTHGCTPPRTPPGAVWFYETANPTVPAGSFTLPRAQGLSGELTCTIHNYTVVPVKDRYLLVTAAYQAGTSVIDFTDPANAREIAYYDAKGLDGNPAAYTWSSYWYNGLIYANDIERGVDIFRLTDTSAVQRPAKFDYLNPQTQERQLR